MERSGIKLSFGLSVHFQPVSAQKLPGQPISPEFASAVRASPFRLFGGVSEVCPGRALRSCAWTTSATPWAPWRAHGGPCREPVLGSEGESGLEPWFVGKAGEKIHVRWKE